jgi:hypothetical protein
MAMSTFQASLQFHHRSKKRREVEDFFEAHLNQNFSSYWLHTRFGPGVRSRISDINTDPGARISIKNELYFDREKDEEISGYRAKLRNSTKSEYPD